MNSGIYLITNTLNGKKYVGQSLGIRKRFSRHRRAARLKLKREAFYLHNAISKHGEDNEQKAKLRGLDKSYTKTPEYRAMMSAALKKRGISPEHRAKINAAKAAKRGN